MCTVSFLPFGGKIFLTSNRDEVAIRPAEAPKWYEFPNGKIWFPKDAKGGTWIGVRENGNAMVLLNGGFIKHKHTPPYRKSRGLIFLEILNAAAPEERFKTINLDGIEPFTLVLWQKGRLYELRWDEKQKFLSEKDKEIPHFWSSVTLYDETVRIKRQLWFETWLRENDTYGLESIMQFHESGGDGDVMNDLRMKRNEELMTLSITGIEWQSGQAKMIHKDLLNDRRHSENIFFNTVPGT